MASEHAPIDGFEAPVPVGDPALRLPVYVSKQGAKPLIVLHELPGLRPDFIDYCRKMAEEGYKVHMPLLFKTPGTDMNVFEYSTFCLTAEFKRLFSSRGSANAERPFTLWLLKLIEHVAADAPDRPIGILGMCLTGNFALAAIASPRVQAAIACQPAWPAFRDIETLGLTEKMRQAVRDGAKIKPAPCARD